MTEHWTKNFTKEELRECRRMDQADAFLDTPVARRVFNALDVLGWKVVPQRELMPHEDGRWPVPIGTRAKWPSWCNHEFSASEIAKRAKPQRPKLRLIEQHPDDDGDAHA